MKPTAHIMIGCHYQSDTFHQIQDRMSLVSSPDYAEILFLPRRATLGKTNSALSIIALSGSYEVPSVPEGVVICRPTDFTGVTSTVEHTWGLIHAVHRRIPAAAASAAWDREQFITPPAAFGNDNDYYWRTRQDRERCRTSC